MSSPFAAAYIVADMDQYNNHIDPTCDKPAFVTVVSHRVRSRVGLEMPCCARQFGCGSHSQEKRLTWSGLQVVALLLVRSQP